jgi:hypothetical protein
VKEMADSLPWNFDWVTATHECSPVLMVGKLTALAQSYVDTRNRQAQADGRFHLSEFPSGFSVEERTVGGLATKVTFEFPRAMDRISVYRGRETVLAHYVLTLNEDHECRLRNTETGETLAPWQALKAALEPLLFSTSA